MECHLESTEGKKGAKDLLDFSGSEVAWVDLDDRLAGLRVNTLFLLTRSLPSAEIVRMVL